MYLFFVCLFVRSFFYLLLQETTNRSFKSDSGTVQLTCRVVPACFFKHWVCVRGHLIRFTSHLKTLWWKPDFHKSIVFFCKLHCFEKALFSLSPQSWQKPPDQGIAQNPGLLWQPADVEHVIKAYKSFISMAASFTWAADIQWSSCHLTGLYSMRRIPPLCVGQWLGGQMFLRLIKTRNVCLL